MSWSSCRSGRLRACGNAVSGWLLGLAALAAVSCASEAKEATSFVEGGVRVHAFIEATADSDQVVVTFEPEARGFHLFSMSHDPRESRGLGYPTVVELLEGMTAGPWQADRESSVRSVDALGVSVLVYPDGPVRLTAPLRDGEHPLHLSVSYAACSDSKCLQPVVDRQLVLRREDRGN